MKDLDKKDNIWLARVRDACENNVMPRYFGFFDERMCMVLEAALKLSGEPYLFWGGMPDAGRKMLCVFPDYVEIKDLEWPIAAFRFEKDFPIDHRHVLGELMSLGIDRSCLGDIYVADHEVQVIFTSKMQTFFEQSIQKIKGRPVKLCWLNADEIRSYDLKFKAIHLVVSSERIDGIIGKIWGFSRQEALRLIAQKRLRINYQEVTKNDRHVAEGDILSLRGKGKAKIAVIDGQRTKKNNLRMIVYRYV